MSLNVTSAPQTLALLQALSLQNSGSQATAQTSSAQTSGAQTSGAQTSSASTLAATASASTVTAGGAVQQMFAAADGVAQALTAADAAGAAGQGVIGLLQQMHAYAGQAADPAASAGDRAALERQFQASARQIAPTLSGATVNGLNLVDGSMASSLKVTLGDGSTASLTPVDLTLGGSTLGAAAQPFLATPQAAASASASIGTALGGASAGLSTLQTQADQISAHTDFVQTLASASATSADVDGDSARLLALQVSQQLSGQTTAIANGAPQSILSLFRS